MFVLIISACRVTEVIFCFIFKLIKTETRIAPTISLRQYIIVAWLCCCDRESVDFINKFMLIKNGLGWTNWMEYNRMGAEGRKGGEFCALCYSFPSHSLKLLIKIAWAGCFMQSDTFCVVAESFAAIQTKNSRLSILRISCVVYYIQFLM